jgi:hypothetical protein
MRTPPHVVAYRSAAAALTVVILASIGLGLAGDGPLAALHRAAEPVARALHLDRISGQAPSPGPARTRSRAGRPG